MTQIILTQLDMKLQYCKPETEVDYLVLENDFLTGTTVTVSTTSTIDDDLDGPESIDW